MAIAVAHFSYTWGYYTLLTQLPSYMNDILDFDLQKSGFISAIPYLVLSLLLFVSGYLADWLQMKNVLSTTQVRKYFNNLSFFSEMIFLLLAAYFTNTTLIIVCITLSVGLGAFSISGYLANPLDIAPQFASIIVGYSNTFATLPGLISPILTGYIVTTPVNFARKKSSNTFQHIFYLQSDAEYKKVFFIASGVYLIGIFFYAIFATGKVQIWAVKSVETSTAQLR